MREPGLVEPRPDAPRTAAAIIRSARPRQWTKNLLLFAAVIFAGEFGRAVILARVVAGFAVFCAASGAVYLLNDVVDAERDRGHATKRLRPVASGELPAASALLAAGALLAGSLAAAFALGVPFALVTAAYVALQVAYTMLLKKWAFVDVLAVAVGFVLRAIAGAVVVPVSFSPWLLACVALLALFLALAKRRHELLLLNEAARGHRESLGGYTERAIDIALAALTAATIVAYAAYALLSATAREHGFLVVTVPFVVFGLARYLYLVYRRDLGGNPEEILLTDFPLIASIALWLVASATAILL